MIFRYLSFYIFILLFWSISTSCVFADTKQVLSVTPPLFQLSALPGDTWQSSVKIVNGNPYPLTVYAEVVNFAAMGERGQGTFVPIHTDSVGKTTLADWVVINTNPIVIPPEQTKDIPFFADVPKDAPPGGHYAAIMISTEEPENTNGLSVLASQTVTSLLFLRVEGDVHEEGLVREFNTKKTLLDKPDAEFLLRFENKGNVHLQPRGVIVISNMWGTERGTIPVNYQTHYGNVLPNSIRAFSFGWRSDFKITDIGRYKAEVTLAYGEDGIKSTSAVTYFWVIPIKWTLITIAIVSFFIWLIVRMIRAYVRRMLELAGVQVPVSTSHEDTAQNSSHSKQRMSIHTHSYRVVSAPIRAGVLDLRNRLNTHDEEKNTLSTVIDFVLQYKRFFLSVFTLICIVSATLIYIQNATKNDATYEVIINNEIDETTFYEDVKSEGRTP